MKTLKHGLVVTIALLMGSANVAAMASAAGNGADDWFKAKMGRSSPATEAQVKAEKAVTAYREAEVAAPADTWRENFWRAKFGRSSPMMESATVYRQEAVAPKMPAETRLQDFARMKWGR